MTVPASRSGFSDEVIRLLDPKPGQIVVDCTVGAGGHSRLLAERVGPTGRVIGLDQDAAMLELARPRLADLPVTLIHASFDQLREVLNDAGNLGDRRSFGGLGNLLGPTR